MLLSAFFKEYTMYCFDENLKVRPFGCERRRVRWGRQQDSSESVNRGRRPMMPERSIDRSEPGVPACRLSSFPLCLCTVGSHQPERAPEESDPGSRASGSPSEDSSVYRLPVDKPESNAELAGDGSVARMVRSKAR